VKMKLRLLALVRWPEKSASRENVDAQRLTGEHCFDPVPEMAEHVCSTSA